MALKYIIYLSVEQFKEIKTNGSVVVNGQTIVDSPDNDYRVPDETQEQIADLQAEQAVQGAKITTLQSAVNNLKLEMFPVGSRYTQYPDEPEPAERFGGTWDLDEDAMDKFLVGAGNLYALGSTGGSADAVVVEHTHTFENLSAGAESIRDDGYALQRGYGGASIENVGNNTALYSIASTGEDGTNKNLPPYLAVNIWKRTA